MELDPKVYAPLDFHMLKRNIILQKLILLLTIFDCFTTELHFK